MKKALYTTLVFVIVIALISAFGLDIKTSSLLFNKTALWIYYNYPLWTFLYRYGQVLPNLIGITAALMLTGSFITKKLSFAKNRAMFALIVFLLGPGLIVQTLKVTWGRPRPVETIEYGGNFEFRTPFEPNFALAGNRKDGNSFPSGHAAAGFYTMALYFIFRKRWIFALTFVYGAAMGAARMVQGGHYLSDIVSSFFIVYICMELFEFLIRKKQK